jgi:hypothetical protein
VKYICTEDIENLAAQGKTELVMDVDTVLMDLARDTARQLGIAIVDGSHPSPVKAPSPAAPPSPAKESSPAKAPSQAASAPASNGSANGSAPHLGAKPKGCQHGPLTVAARPAPVKSHQSSDGVVDQLVELVRQSIGKTTGK